MKPKSSPIEAIVARDVEGALRLRLQRMTSATICRRMLAGKHPGMPDDVIAQKAEGIASALRSALGYWDSGRAALNAKLLSQYYFALQLSIAEEVASADPNATLESIQKHTEQGHGLKTLRPPDGVFPRDCFVAVLKSGHFNGYCTSRGIDLNGIAFDSARSWSKVKDDPAKLVSLTGLLRRVPELRSLIHDCLGEPALSFHVVSSSKNLEANAARFAAGFSTAEPKTHDTTAEIETFLTFATGFGGGEGVTPEYLTGLGFPIADFRVETDPVYGREQIVGVYKHRAKEHWHESIGLYRSEVGSTLIAPLWQQKADMFLLHFMTLYALSIVVRYLPSYWYDIEHGKLDHLRALLEHYVTVVDAVVPQLAIERIIGKDVAVVTPGAFNAPV